MLFQRRYLLLFLSILILVAITYFFSDLVTYIVGAWVLALIGTPIKKIILTTTRLHKLKGGNVIASILTLLIFMSFIIIILTIFIPILGEQFNVLTTVDYNKIATTLQAPLASVEAYLKKIGFLQDSASLLQEISIQIKNILVPAEVTVFFSSIVNTIASIGIAIGSILFIGFFFIRDQGLFESSIRSFVPDKYEVAITKAISDIGTLLSRYFGGLIIQSCSIWLIISTTLSIMGFHNAWLIGFFAGMVNIVPYLGPWIGAGFGALMTITANVDMDFTTQILPMLIQMAAVFGITQLIDNFLISPMVFSNRVIAHPLEIFIVVLLGAKIGGLVGMIIAIPMYTILRVLAGVFLIEFKVVQRITAGIRKATETSPADQGQTEDISTK